MHGKSVCVTRIGKLCKSKLSSHYNGGTSHFLSHQKSYKKKFDHATMVYNRLVLNPNGSIRNQEYKHDVARVELCCLIVKLDLPLRVGDTDDQEEYIQCAHNSRFAKVSRFTITCDLVKLYNEKHAHLKNVALFGVSSIALTSGIWFGNTKEDYITIVTYFINAN